MALLQSLSTDTSFHQVCASWSKLRHWLNAFKFMYKVIKFNGMYF